jgi:hypothetical protein
MSPNEYKLATRQTAIYPNAIAVPYLTLGLVSEIDELNRAVFIASEQGLIKESGDVMWYCFRLFDELGITVNPQWEHYTGEPIALPQTFNIMSRNTAAIADIVKKSIRDNDGIVPPEKVEQVGLALTIILMCVGSLAQRQNDLYHTHLHGLEAYATVNIDKLASRHNRGVIGGSGDDR